MNQSASMTLPDVLAVYRFLDAKHTNSEASARFRVSVNDIKKMIERRPTLESKISTLKKRRNLSNGEKEVVAHFLDQNNSVREAMDKFKLIERVVRRIKKFKCEIRQRIRNGAPLSVSRPLRAKYPILEERVSDLVKFLRLQRMVVSMEVIQTRACMVASDLNLPYFEASRGWMEKFIRRDGIQSPMKLHGKGQAILPENVAQRIAEIQNIARDYELCNIYNQDESGLFYRLCQSRSYLSNEEGRALDRGSHLQKAKQRLTVSFAVNSNGSHILPIRYIGSARVPTCFRLHPETRKFYSAQNNAWMDGNQF